MARCNNCGRSLDAENTMSCGICGDIMCTTCGDRLGICENCSGELKYWN